MKRFAFVVLLLSAFLALGSSVLGLSPTPAAAEPSARLKPCVGGPSWTEDETLAACTAVIDAVGPVTDETVIALFNRGNIYKRRQLHDLALRDYSEAIRLRPDQPLFYNNRGVTYYETGKPDLAIPDFDQAIRLNPKYAEAYNNRGNAYKAMKQNERAIQDYDQAISLRPVYPHAYSNRGTAKHNLGDDAEAIKDYDVAIAQRAGEKPGAVFAEAYVNRCLSFAALSQFDRALKDCDRAVEAAGRPIPEVFNNRGIIYAAQGDYVRAIANYTEAINLRPRYAKALGNRGVAHFRRKPQDLEKALADLRQANELDSSLDDVHQTLRIVEDAAQATASRARARHTGRRVALVIGNSVYANTSLVPNAASDAEDVATALKLMGYEVFGTQRVNLRKQDMRAAIAAFATEAKGARSAIVWYAGHGQQTRESGSENANDWVIPVDASIRTKADVDDNAINVDDLVNAVNSAKLLRLVVVDACRNSTFWNENRGLARRTIRREGALVVFSAGPGEAARDEVKSGDRNSPFTGAFLDELRADSSRDVRVLFSDVTVRTRNLTNGEQNPQSIDGGLGGTVAIGN